MPPQPSAPRVLPKPIWLLKWSASSRIARHDGQILCPLDGETEEIAEAIEQHYQPRFVYDKLPESKIAAAVALADKLETWSAFGASV